MLVNTIRVSREQRDGDPTLVVYWLFTAGPDQTVSLEVVDWGDGASEVFIPEQPAFAFTHSHVYAGPPGLPPSLDAVASFNLTLRDAPEVSVQQVSLYLTPDVRTGVERGVDWAHRSLTVLGAGNDTLRGGAQEDTVHGGEGRDFIATFNGADLVHGEAGADTLMGGAGNDSLFGDLGGDRLIGGDGNDQLDGGDGKDHLNGGEGDDLLLGGPRRDSLVGGAGNDVLRGEDGDDVMRGDAGADTMWGGIGDDRIQGNAGDDRLYGGGGRDLLNGGAGNDTLQGDYGDSTLLGGDGDDLMYGGYDNDLLNGGAGDDLMLGGTGNDTLIGGEGADTFFGDMGADVLQTSADGARDVFVYSSYVDVGDIIRGFVSGEDVIYFDLSFSAFLVQGVAPVAEWWGGPTLLFDTSNGRLSMDEDGLGGDPPVLFATLRGVTSLVDSDIFYA